MLYFLAWRDIKVRYKQTFMGIAWAALQPLVPMVVFTILFGRFAGLERRTGDIPYFLFVFTGLLPWTFFASAVTTGGVSLVANSNLVSKVYFPRLVVPLAAVFVAAIDSIVSAILLLALLVRSGVMPGERILLAPVFFAATVLLAAGIAALLAALTVTYRDVRYVVPFALQIWMFVTPVIYPVGMIPERWQWLLILNPVAGLVEGFRAAILPMPINASQLICPLAASLAVFLVGTAYFRHVERRFADII